MNRELERWVLRMPAQYFWTHKRFKTRPQGSRACIERSSCTRLADDVERSRTSEAHKMSR